MRTARGCYLVGTRVHLSGSGFAPDRAYVISIDGVYFGRGRTNANGALGSDDSLRPGGLPAGTAQVVDRLEASDGTRAARTRFTVTRRPGARFLASSGSSSTLRAPVEVLGIRPRRHAPQRLPALRQPLGPVRRHSAARTNRWPVWVPADGPDPDLSLHPLARPLDAPDRHPPQLPRRPRRAGSTDLRANQLVVGRIAPSPGTLTGMGRALGVTQSTRTRLRGQS